MVTSFCLLTVISPTQHRHSSTIPLVNVDIYTAGNLQSDLQFTFQCMARFPFIITDCCHMTWQGMHCIMHCLMNIYKVTLCMQQVQLCLHILVVNLYILWKLLWKDIEVGHILIWKTDKQNTVSMQCYFVTLGSSYYFSSCAGTRGWRCDVISTGCTSIQTSKVVSSVVSRLVFYQIIYDDWQPLTRGSPNTSETVRISQQVS